mgnify:FL=1
MRVGMCIDMSMRDCTLVRMHASVHEHMRTHVRAHVCRLTPNPMDAELVGSAVPGRIPAKRQPLPPLYTENTVLFSMLARWIALVAHASHRHQPQPDLIPAGLLS